MTQNCGFFSWTGAKEAFLNRNLLYRDEVVKKCIHDLASPCYSLVLTSPQTALTVAHARKEMVKLTLTGEDKVAHSVENVKAFFFLFVTILVCLSSLSCQPIVLLLVFEFSESWKIPWLSTGSLKNSWKLWLAKSRHLREIWDVAEQAMAFQSFAWSCAPCHGINLLCHRRWLQLC